MKIRTILPKIIEWFYSFLDSDKYDNIIWFRQMYNQEKDPVDNRDYKFIVPTWTKAENIPSSVDLSEWCPPVKSQGNIGSCASHACLSAFEMILKMNTDWFIEGSERHHYYKVRQDAYMGTFPADSGQYIREGIKVLKNIGMCPESLCRYSTYDYNNKPSVLADSYTKFWKIASYQRVWSISSMKFALAANTPVIFGVYIYPSFSYPVDGVLKEPAEDENIAGGHAMVCVGYDDEKQAFLVLNSHGIQYGKKGYIWVSYDYMRKNLLDAWIIENEV